jgi:hypothetical protein
MVTRKIKELNTQGGIPMKKIFNFKIVIMLLSIVLLATSVAAGPVPQQPNVTFTLAQGLPYTMQVGESYTVIVEVTSDTPFIFSGALPTAYYPGRYIVAARGDHSGSGTSATLSVTFTAKGSTSELPDGVAPVAVVAGARFKGGFTASQRFDFFVAVP